MYQDFSTLGLSLARAGGVTPGERGSRPLWTVIVPFFNEREFLPDTIASLAGQSEAFRLVLVDNGSTDGSASVAMLAAQVWGVSFRLVREPRQGKVAALAAGLELVDTRYVATCDADTFYPAGYLTRAQALLERPGCVAAGAYFVEPGASEKRHLVETLHILAAARLFPGQCHAGGAGQVFATAALRRAGGFDPQRWNYVLEDHEIAHQLLKLGRIGYAAGFWCAPSPRERNRASVKWTLAERLAYHALVGRTGDWFFRAFLGPRLAERRLTSERLREQTAFDPVEAACAA